MLPDLDALVSSSALLVLGLLLLPKREWRSIPRRLRAAARDERDHVFGPPPWLGPPPQDPARRWLWLMRRELPRAIELGIPLHTLAVLAEARGTERRLAREEAWPETRAGLLHQHLAGQIAEPALHRRLQQRGLAPPAPKLQWDPPVQQTMPPVSMFVEAQRWLESLRDDQVGGPEPAPRRVVEPAAYGSALEIQTLSRIRISANGEDFAPGLLHRPALGFTWLYLLARAARQRDDRVTRAVLGDELFPRTSPERQRRKLSQRRNEMSSGLPEPLARLIRTDGEYVGLDLTGCDLDVHRLLRLAEAVAAVDDALSNQLVEEAEETLRLSTGEFLPGWEEIERRGTDPGSDVGRVVVDVRHQVVAARLGLADALARAYLARRQPGRAIPHLEEALQLRPDRDELARRLVDAYELGGQRRRAARLREEYGL